MIFINNKPIFLNNYPIEEFHNIAFLSTKIFSQAVSVLENGTLKGLNIYHFPVDEVLEALQNHFPHIQAAGGRVRNAEGKILFIYRDGKWDLPKGKIETGESPAEAALREVSEECGIAKLQITETLKSTYHIYKAENHILKTVYWFDMYTNSAQIPVPQKEEGILKALWKTPQEVEKALENTYPGIRDLFNKII
ncbi:NUDIX hydrolase [Bacteroidetes bacterium endosymbiont of Geopemphigus sp.]|uniref:NUDIX hydrolase n=1 Tax=Bacteroidetes bacterium endosymbiont of Geopemphigus sp. TaxID=2047937 RepID=UPI0018A82888|nr:NUDIX domain-containing protein [Bacteroidetes bacterium endosymbiont of Geopemphigus sp.]